MEKIKVKIITLTPPPEDDIYPYPEKTYVQSDFTDSEEITVEEYNSLLSWIKTENAKNRYEKYVLLSEGDVIKDKLVTISDFLKIAEKDNQKELERKKKAEERKKKAAETRRKKKEQKEKEELEKLKQKYEPNQ